MSIFSYDRIPSSHYLFFFNFPPVFATCLAAGNTLFFLGSQGEGVSDLQGVELGVPA